MATQTTLQHTLISSLERMAEPVRPFAIQAQWCVISVMPDLATNERLNIGVCVLHDNSLHTRFLPNAEPFKKLYGKQKGENFSFLMNMVKQTLKPENWQYTCSPQIQHSKPQPVSGNSIDEILHRLYSSMVTLALIQKEPTTRANISTQDLRQVISNQWKQDNKNLVSRVWHYEDNPIIIPAEWGDRGKQTELRHIQIWTPPDYANNTVRFGSFISLDYKQLAFAELHLLQATQDILQAHTSITKKSKQGALFIYHPHTNRGFLDNEVDNIFYLLHNQMKSNLRFEVEDNIEKLSKAAREFIV